MSTEDPSTNEDGPALPPSFFGREPAYWLSAIAAVVQLASYLVFPLTTDQQGVINAAATMIFGAITALAVDGERGVPALLGAFQALIAVGISFGWHLSTGVQTAVMMFVTALASIVTRTQVVAPASPESRRAVR